MKSLIPEKTTELEKSLPNSTRILKELVLKMSQHQWFSHCSKIEGKKEENERKEKKKAKGHNEPWSYEPRLPWIKKQIKIQEKEKSFDEYRKKSQSNTDWIQDHSEKLLHCDQLVSFRIRGWVNIHRSTVQYYTQSSQGTQKEALDKVHHSSWQKPQRSLECEEYTST